MSNDKAQKDKLKNSILHWANDPLSWFHDKLPAVRLSTQQRAYLSELGKLIRAKIKAFDHPDQLTEEERGYADKIGISIAAGQGVGKDFMAAATMLYFLDVFPYPKITATGLTGKHLRNVLWSECAKVMGLAVKTNPLDQQSPSVLEAVLEWQTERIFHKGIKNPGSRWFAEAVTINPHANEEEQAKTLYGRHEDYQLIVIDEAANVPEPVFGPLEGTLTGKCCIALMIFNPTRAKGYAYNSQWGPDSKLWLNYRWSSEESELVSPEHLAKMRRYGLESNTYRVKVLGLPPLLGSGGLVPYDAIQDAIEKEYDVGEFDPIMCGVDGGGGGDRSVVAIRQGPQVFPLHEKSTPSRDDLIDWSGNILVRENATVAFVDNIGNGWDVFKDLRKRNIDARAADARSTKDLREPERFMNKRAEMYYDMAQAFINRAISIPRDESLIDELGAIQQEQSGGKVKIGDKKEIRKKLGFSPDKADALAFTFYKPDHLFRKVKNKQGNNGVDLTGVFLR